MVDNALLLLIPGLPLLAGLLARSLAGRRPLVAAALGSISLLISAALGLQLTFVLAKDGGAEVLRWSRPWISTTFVEMPLALQVGLEQLLFVVSAALLAAGVLAFALRERRDDPRAGIFHSYLTLFGGSMLLLLCADTLLLFYLAWELLGLFSFLLIAHQGTAEARRAARQAFWTTRATDMALLFMIFVLLGLGWSSFSELSLTGLQGLAPQEQAMTVLLLTSALLMALLAVMGKSALWPFSFWLADAMVAPAPVSALLHAATLVAAGPYLLLRLAPLADTVPFALGIIAGCGALTLLLGGLMALFASDAKRLLAYSTISQLGLVVCGCGLLASHAAYYHLLVHAWCKAALFLAVGILAARQAGSGHSGLAELSGSARGKPLLLLTLWLSGLSLAGLPLLGGSAGKEQLLWAALTRAGQELSVTGAGQTITIELGKAMPAAVPGWNLSAVLLLLGLPLTAAYLGRLLWLLAGRKQTAQQGSNPDDSAWLVPSGIALAFALVGSLGLGGGGGLGAFSAFRAWFLSDDNRWQWMPESRTAMAAGVGLLLAMIGLALSRSLLRPRLDTGRGPAAFLANGMHLREFWYAVVAETGLWLAVAAGRAERGVFETAAQRSGAAGRWLSQAAGWLDRHVVDGLRWQVCELCWRLKRWHSRYLQNGDIQHYMLVVLVAAVVLCLVVIRPLSHIFARALERL